MLNLVCYVSLCQSLCAGAGSCFNCTRLYVMFHCAKACVLELVHVLIVHVDCSGLSVIVINNVIIIIISNSNSNAFHFIFC